MKLVFDLPDNFEGTVTDALNLITENVNVMGAEFIAIDATLED